MFLSHAWEDKLLVTRLEKELKTTGVDVWVDHSDVRAGDQISKRVSDALEWCNTLLLLWSKDAKTSKWVQLELNAAISLHKTIIPCLIDNTKLPGILSGTAHLDFHDIGMGIAKLLSAIDMSSIHKEAARKHPKTQDGQTKIENLARPHEQSEYDFEPWKDTAKVKKIRTLLASNRDSPVLGIELGNSQCCISVFERSVLRTLSIDGEIIIPNVIQYREKRRSDITIGRIAKKARLINPDEVAVSANRYLYDDSWKEKEELRAKFTIDEIQLEPVDIVADFLRAILKKLNQQKDIDSRGPLRRGVISIPATSNDEYRKNICRAANLAGMGVDDNYCVGYDVDSQDYGIWLLEEPLCVAMAYGQQRGILNSSRQQYHIIYSLDEISLSISILYVDYKNIDSPSFRIINTKSSSEVCGYEFDLVIMMICSERFKDDTGIDIFDLRSDQAGTSGKQLKRAQAKLYASAVETRIEFQNGAQRSEIAVPYFLTDGNGKNHHIESEISRDEFLKAIKPILNHGRNLLTEALVEAGLSIEEVNKISLVGRGTQSKWVIDSIKTLYPSGKEKEPYVTDETIVSQGAATYGSIVG